MSAKLPPPAIAWINRQKEKGLSDLEVVQAFEKIYATKISVEDLSKVLAKNSDDGKISTKAVPILEPVSLTSNVSGSKIQKDYERAAAELSKPQSVRRSKNSSPERAHRDPSNHYVTEFEVGRYYVIPGHGIRRFLEKRDDVIPGEKAIFATFVDSKQKHKSMVPLKEIADIGIREVLLPEEMDKLLQKLERGKPSKPVVLNKTFNQSNIPKKFWNEIDWSVHNKDVFAMADILCDFFGKKPKDFPQAGAKETLALKVIDAIADEYAIVMGAHYEEALRIINDKSGYSRFLELRAQKDGISKPTPLLPPP